MGVSGPYNGMLQAASTHRNIQELFSEVEAEVRFKVERLFPLKALMIYPSYLPSSHLVDNAPANKKASERFPFACNKDGNSIEFSYQKGRFIAKKACGRCMRIPCPAALSVHQERTPEVIRLIRRPTPWSMMACLVYLEVIDLWESCCDSPMNRLGACRGSRLLLLVFGTYLHVSHPWSCIITVAQPPHISTLCSNP